MPKKRPDEPESIRRGVLRLVREGAEKNVAIPSEPELASRLGCSRQQIRHALAELAGQGVVVRRQGAPTVVDPVSLRLSVRLEEQVEHSVLLRRMGYLADSETLSAEIVPLPPELENYLTVSAETHGLRAERRWTADGRFAMVARNFLLLPDLASLDGLDRDQSIFSLVEQVWKESIVWEVATVGATGLGAREAQLLGLPRNAPALTMDMIGITVRGRRVFHTTEYHHPDVAKYSLVRSMRPNLGQMDPDLLPG